MDAIRLIKENVSPSDLLEFYHFEGIKHRNGYIRCACKLHNGDNESAFVMSESSGLWHCHTGGCGSGDIFTLVQYIENVSFVEAVKLIAQNFNIDIENVQIKERTSTYIKQLQEFTKLVKLKKQPKPEPYKLEVEGKREMQSYKNFLPETIDHFGAYYAEKVHLINKGNKPYTLYNRIAFPIIIDSTTIGYSLRATTKQGAKWVHQPTHINAGSLLYNFNVLKSTDTIVVCEGITDVWAYHEIGVPAICTFGSHLTHSQYRLLLLAGVDVTLSYDNDEAGVLATKSAITLLKNKANIYTIQLPNLADPASITREELLRAYQERRRA